MAFYKHEDIFGISVDKKSDDGIDNEAGKFVKNTNNNSNSVNEKENDKTEKPVKNTISYYNSVKEKDDDGIVNEIGKLVKNTDSYSNSVNKKENIRNAVAGKIHCLK